MVERAGRCDAVAEVCHKKEDVVPELKQAVEVCVC